MIVYKSNKNFFGDISHLYKSWTIQKIIRGVLGFGIYAAIVCLPAFHLDLADFLVLDLAVLSFLGVVLSILLVFRTNSAYDRWWEGRKQWGALVNHCRNMAIQLNVILPLDDKKNKMFFAIRISNFCFAFVEHLREGTKLDKLVALTDAEKQKYEKLTHVPNFISMEIQNRVEQVYRAEVISGFDLRNVKPHTQALLDILGACERIKKTPIPFSYAVFIKIFILGYGFILPFSLMDMFGWGTILITMFVMFAFLGIELMAEEIEDPFGLDCNDLPTGTIATTISHNVCEIFEIEDFVPVEEAELYSKIF